MTFQLKDNLGEGRRTTDSLGDTISDYSRYDFGQLKQHWLNQHVGPFTDKQVEYIDSGKTTGNHDRTETVYSGAVWGEQNVYIFPEKNRHVRGCLWVIPPVDNTSFEYEDNPGCPGQHFAYNKIKEGIEFGHIPQDDWIIIIGPHHQSSVDRMWSNSAETFEEQVFNYKEHIDLCGCCKDDQNREFINAVIAINDGANAVDWNDHTITNVILVDPILYPPVNIPDALKPNVSIVANPTNQNADTFAGTQTLTALAELDDVGGYHVEASDVFNSPGLLGAALAAVNFAALTQALFTAFQDQNVDTITELANKETDLNNATSGSGIIADPSSPERPPEGSLGGAPTGCADWSEAQVMITSDRLVFNARTDCILLSADGKIGLSSNSAVGIDTPDYFCVNAPEIYLGLGATEPLILGDKFQSWAESLIDMIKLLTYTNAGGPTGPAMNKDILNTVRNQIPELKSPQNKTL
tara:strand:+ start:5652 stop:7052 length:1401 start_codon:yes stop_codon:yes gene_type:complete